MEHRRAPNSRETSRPQIGSQQWLAMVLDGAAQLGVDLDERQAHQFARHARMLMQWNRKHNLTTIVDPVQVAVKHFLDAIAPAAHIPPNGRLLDMGTGGGFPGIPLKIMRPLQPMLLIDGRRKKISFVKQVIRELALTRIEARQVRLEILGGEKENRSAFDVIVCRALGNLEQVVHWAAPLLTPAGRIVAYQGPGDSRVAETGKLQYAMKLHGAHYRAGTLSYRLPLLKDRRSVTIIKPEA